jgi:hypothetical protein
MPGMDRSASHRLDFSTTFRPGAPGQGRPRGRRRREPALTGVLATVALALALLGACGGSSTGGETYQQAISEQEACCNELGDPAAREQCLGGIVRVDDPAVQQSDLNKATYACIERHFVCDGMTGGPTQASSQAQLDCINDLSQ